jgi:Bacterial capsule synthesis protein PGA_cap
MILWQSPAAEPVAARIAIAGDFIPAGNLDVPSGGWHEAAQTLAPTFAGCDATFLNLECALDCADLRPRPPAGLGQTVSAPAACLDYVRSLTSATTILGSANNHSFDFNLTGVERTRAAVARSGMIPIGAGRTLRDSPDTWLWQGPGEIRVGFWAAAIASRDLATKSAAGVEPATIARAAEAIANLKSRGARICIALLHAGALRTNRTDPEEISTIDSIAATGFNVVAGSHSHRISGARQLESSGTNPIICLYGLGSIASGYVNSRIEREGLVVVAALDARGDLASIELRTVWLADSGFGAVPSPQVHDAILQRFQILSRELADGTAAGLFYRDISGGLFRLYARDIYAAARRAGLRGLAIKAGRVRLRHVKRIFRAVFA